jgi:phosphoglycolate phosphatase-like HAD superfamily hydrolase
MPPTVSRVPVFDFDGTLVDSDAALTAPFTALGVDPATIPLGLPLGEACDRAGITVDDYVAHYDSEIVRPFPGVEELLAGLARWGLCSNKTTPSGRAELARLGWSPAASLFSEDFGGRPKQLAPVLAALGLEASHAVFVGDTDHDRHCARAAGVTFALAGWNARATPEPGDIVLAEPAHVLDLVA